MLIQPVTWHLKKVEEEVPVDEKVQLLPENKHQNIVIRKNSIANELQKPTNHRRATEPELTNGEKRNGFDGKISQSHNELSVSNKKAETKRVNGKLKIKN